MPHLGDYGWIIDSVVFLYKDAKDAKSGTNTGGTGFLVGVPSIRWSDKVAHVHVVTNWHVACDGAPVVRVNRRQGVPEFFEFDSSDWVFRGGWSDLAVSPLINWQQKVHTATVLTIESLMSAEKEKGVSLMAGEDVFMVGRFVDYDGHEVNQPSLRFGHISILDARVRQPTGYAGRSIVVDMHSRTGYSGSPVIVYRTPGSTICAPDKLVLQKAVVSVMGVLWGQFPEAWELKDGKKINSRQNSNLITDGKYVEGMSGMSCVIPAADILELLNHKDLKSMREKAEIAFERSGQAPSPLAPKPTVAGHSSTDENPTHREDFTRLVNAAARKPPQGDQT